MEAITIFPKNAEQSAAFRQFLAAFHIPFDIEPTVEERLKEAFQVAKQIERGDAPKGATWDEFMAELKSEG